MNHLWTYIQKFLTAITIIFSLIFYKLAKFYWSFLSNGLLTLLEIIYLSLII